MEKLEAECTSCSPDDPATRRVHVRVIVSKGERSVHVRALLSGVIRTGDEFLIDDESTGEAYPVRVTSIEVGDKRKDRSFAEDIKTLWARAIEEVVVKIAISHRQTTESIEMSVPGEREFIVGEKFKVDNRELQVIRIKIRDGGFKSRRGTAVAAKDIKRIYADSGIAVPKRISRGERVVIKKRESVWSLKRKETGS